MRNCTPQKLFAQKTPASLKAEIGPIHKLDREMSAMALAQHRAPTHLPTIQPSLRGIASPKAPHQARPSTGQARPGRTEQSPALRYATLRYAALRCAAIQIHWDQRRSRSPSSPYPSLLQNRRKPLWCARMHSAPATTLAERAPTIRSRALDPSRAHQAPLDGEDLQG